MIQKIENIKDIKWYVKTIPLKEKNLDLLKDFPFKLPKLFIDLLKISDGGRVDYVFDYYDEYFQELLIGGGGIGQIYGICTKSSKMLNKNYDPDSLYDNKEYFITHNNIIDNYYDPPEFFPKNLVAFGSNGGGNKICFDYRADPNTDNPPIVYWIMGRYEGKDISFLANNFEEFLGILKEPDDDDEFEKALKADPSLLDKVIKELK